MTKKVPSPKHVVTLLLADTAIIGRGHRLEVWVKHVLAEVTVASVDIVQAPGELIWPVP